MGMNAHYEFFSRFTYQRQFLEQVITWQMASRYLWPSLTPDDAVSLPFADDFINIYIFIAPVTGISIIVDFCKLASHWIQPNFASATRSMCARQESWQLFRFDHFRRTTENFTFTVQIFCGGYFQKGTGKQVLTILGYSRQHVLLSCGWQVVCNLCHASGIWPSFPLPSIPFLA